MENKTVAIIQARLTSTRFPKKILEKIDNLTLIEFLVKYTQISKPTKYVKGERRKANILDRMKNIFKLFQFFSQPTLFLI